MDSYNKTPPIVLLLILLLLIFSQLPGGHIHPAIRIAAADNVIEEQPLPSNILSEEQAHPRPSRIDVIILPPPGTREEASSKGSVAPALITAPDEEPGTGTAAPDEIAIKEVPPVPAVAPDEKSQTGTSAPDKIATPAPSLPDTPLGDAPQTTDFTEGVATVESIPLQAAFPSEEPLWELLNDKKFQAVLEEIDKLRKQYPGWEPPEQLVTLAEDGLLQSDISQALAEGNFRRLFQVARSHPKYFSCSHLDWAWSLAQAYAAQDRTGALFDLLTRLISRCSERDRLATLQKATAWVDTDTWERLADRESRNTRTPEVDAQFHRMRYDHDIERLLAADKTSAGTEFFQRFERLSDDVIFYRDGDIALLAAWTFLDIRDTDNAAQWFEKMRNWDPDNVDAIRGLALCALAENRYSDARLLADRIPDGSEEKEDILRNAILGMAQAEYEKNNYDSTVKLLAEAGDRSKLPRYVQLMAAWSLLHLGDYPQALERFQEVHRKHPDEESAQGLFNALISTTDTIDPEQYKGDEFLGPLINNYLADQAFFQKRFITAKALAPERYEHAGGIGTPRLTWYPALRDKSGTTGLSKLQDAVHSLEAIWPARDRTEFHFRIDYHQLDSGTFGREPRLYMARGLLTGALGIGENDPVFNGLAESAADLLQIKDAGNDVNVWEPHLTWRRESLFDVEADIGLSVLGGVKDPRLIGHLSLSDIGSWGNYTLTGYARPIRESILSYTGWRLDRFLPETPFNGKRWGGVRAFGAELSGYKPLGNRFGFSGKIGVEQIDANNVRSNAHGFLVAGFNRDLGLDGFDYFAPGINISYDHYNHNLSQFTPGHGGYFSPQKFMQLKANLDFLTLEKSRMILKGHLDAGRVYKREATTPIIPLSGFRNMGNYQGSSEWGWSYTVELDGAMQVSDHIQWGAAVSYRAAPQYDEAAGMLFIRVLFDKRSAVLSSDLSGRILEAVR